MYQLTAIVFMPVKSVTVALPPSTSIELTMMFVANLSARKKLAEDASKITDAPKEHEHQMG